MKVLVTGASGFLGGVLCPELAARGHEVLALVRRPGSEPAGSRPVAGDLGDGESLRAALVAAAPDGVVHLAAEIATQRDASKIDAVNVEGTRVLLEASVAAGVRRFVFASTVVTGEAGGELLDEESALPVQTAYGRSKQEGERLVLGAELESVIVRPSHVYGAGGWFAEEIVARLRQPGRFAVIGSGENMWDVVRVEDVVTALALGLESAPADSLYHCVDDEPLTYYEFMRLTADALGRSAPRRIPVWLARLAAGRDPVASVVRSARSSNAKLKRELDWSPRYPSAREGVPDAVAALTS